MIEKEVIIKSKQGLHARPAGLIVNAVKNFNGTAEMILDTKTANLKSILNVMSMGVKMNTAVTIKLNGENEEAFLNDIVEILESE